MTPDTAPPPAPAAPRKRDDWATAFVGHLREYVAADDRAALARLRRGLSRPAGEDVGVIPYVQPWLGRDADERLTRAAYLVASLFALHPESAAGSLGASFRALSLKPNQEQGAQRRLVSLLNANFEELPRRLRQAVTLLRAHDVGLDWPRLLRDILYWRPPRRPVQRRWASDFWSESENPNP